MSIRLPLFGLGCVLGFVTAASADPPRADVERAERLYVKRQLLFPMLELFDAPSTNDSCPQRAESIVPTRALVMMNDEFIEEQAERLAERVQREAPAEAGLSKPGPSEPGLIDRLFERTIGRRPSPERLRSTQEFVRQRESAYAGAAIVPAEARRGALADAAYVLLNSSEFAFVE